MHKFKDEKIQTWAVIVLKQFKCSMFKDALLNLMLKSERKLNIALIYR